MKKINKFYLMPALFFLFGLYAHANLFPHIPLSIYGDDSRIEPFLVMSPIMQQAARSTVALIPRENLVPNVVQNNYTVRAPRAQQSQQLCADQAFAQQPTAAICSGVLIAPDLVLTAGHCVLNQHACRGLYFVFDYRYNAQADVDSEITVSAVYKCEELITPEYQEQSVIDIDYSIIRLNRVVLEAQPASMASDPNQLPLETHLALIGHPMGLPQKFAANAQMMRWNPLLPTQELFRANVDAFHGNSGSPVFNEQTGQLVGILQSGDTDTYPDQRSHCMRYSYFPLDFGPNTQNNSYEQIMFTGSVVNFLNERRANASTATPAAEATSAPQEETSGSTD